MWQKDLMTLSVEIVHPWLIYLLLILPTLPLIYNITLHPLSLFPGPRLSALTRLPFSYNSLKGRRHTWIRHLHDHYGPVVRVAPNELSFSSSQAWRDIYGKRKDIPGGGVVVGKDMMNYRAFLGPAAENVFVAEGETHARMRGLFAKFFSPKTLLSDQEPVLQEFTDKMLSHISRQSHTTTEKKRGTVDMQPVYFFFGVDVISALLFQDSFDQLETDSVHPWLATFFQNLKGMAFGSVLMYYPLLMKLLQTVFAKTMQEAEDKHFGYVYREVDKRIEAGGGKWDKNLWSYTQSGEDDGGGLSRSEMRANAALLMVAGAETSAGAIVSTTFFLLSNPECWDKAVEEVRSKFTRLEDITLNALAGLPYLNACIHEALRMYPPNPTGLPRRTPKGGVRVCGRWIPGDMVIYASHYAAAHSVENFVEPDTFIPDRWLEEGRKEDARFAADKRDASRPFSYGPHDCIGQTFALHEIRLCLAKVLWTFDLQLGEESRTWSQQKSFVLWEKLPLIVRVDRVDGRLSTRIGSV